MNGSKSTAPMRFFYVDDSGSVDTGYIVYSWIEVTPECWSVGLRTWLDLRKSLYVSHRIPPSEELHATYLVAGRKNPSIDPAVNRSKQKRRQVMTLALAAIGASPDLAVGTIYRKTTAKGAAYARERDTVYERLIDHLDSRLALADERGLIFMDGNGTDPSYQRAHRQLKLRDRRIIEDPLFQGAHNSQWVQMADLVAWSTYQHLLRHPGKRFAWNWFSQHLETSDVNGGPVEV